MSQLEKKTTSEPCYLVEDMPRELDFIDIDMRERTLKLMLHPSSKAGVLEVSFSDVLAVMESEEFIASIFRIDGVCGGTPVSRILDATWPFDVKGIKEVGYVDVQHYRFFSEHNVVDVLAFGSVTARWQNPIASSTESLSPADPQGRQ